MSSKSFKRHEHFEKWNAYLRSFVGVLLPKMSSLNTFRLIEENLSLQGRSCLLLMDSPNLKVPASRVVGEGP